MLIMHVYAYEAFRHKCTSIQDIYVYRYTCIYIYIYRYTHTYIYIYTYRVLLYIHYMKSMAQYQHGMLPSES